MTDRTMTEMGLTIGDRVVWNCPDMMDYDTYLGRFVHRTVHHAGKITKDFSEYPSPSGERFVYILDEGSGKTLGVSTAYLSKLDEVP